MPDLTEPQGVFEMGSIFKVLNTTIALGSGAAHMSDKYEVSKPLYIGGHRIADYHMMKRDLSLSSFGVFIQYWICENC